MKKKIHIALLIGLCGFFAYGSIFTFIKSDRLETWESLARSSAGERMDHAMKIAEQFHRSQTKGLAEQIHPDLLMKSIQLEAHPIVVYFFTHEPQAVWALGYNIKLTPDENFYSYTFQYDFAGEPIRKLIPFFKRDLAQPDDPYSLFLTIQEQEKNGRTYIVGINVEPVSSELKLAGKFQLKGKSLFELGFIALALLIPLFILFTLIQFVRMPEACQKIRWFFFIALGFVTVTLNWGNGTFSIAPISFQLLGIGIAKVGIYAPWTISTSIPIGALIFLFNRKKWLK